MVRSGDCYLVVNPLHRFAQIDRVRRSPLALCNRLIRPADQLRMGVETARGCKRPAPRSPLNASGAALGDQQPSPTSRPHYPIRRAFRL